jgi:hypothetical protein
MVDSIAAEDSPAPRLSEIETLAGDVRLTDRSYWAALDVHDDLEHPVVRAAHDDYLHALERFIEAPVVSGRDLTVKIAVATGLLRAGDSERALGLLSAMLADVQLMDLAARRDAERRSDEAAARRVVRGGAAAADEPVPVPAG